MKTNQKTRWAFFPFKPSQYSGMLVKSFADLRDRICHHISFCEFCGMLAVFDEEGTYIGHMVALTPSASSPVIHI